MIFVKALTFEQFSHNIDSCTFKYCRYSSFKCLKKQKQNEIKQRKLSIDSVAVSHVEKSPLHPECFCADQLTETRMMPPGSLCCPKQNGAIFSDCLYSRIPGDRSTASEYGYHGVSTGSCSTMSRCCTCTLKKRWHVRKRFLKQKKDKNGLILPSIFEQVWPAKPTYQPDNLVFNLWESAAFPSLILHSHSSRVGWSPGQTGFGWSGLALVRFSRLRPHPCEQWWWMFSLSPLTGHMRTASASSCGYSSPPSPPRHSLIYSMPTPRRVTGDIIRGSLSSVLVEDHHIGYW